MFEKVFLPKVMLPKLIRTNPSSGYCLLWCLYLMNLFLDWTHTPTQNASII